MLYLLYLAIFVTFFSFVHSLIVAWRISFLAVVACFFLPPFAQIVYAFPLGHTELRMPVILHIIGLISMIVIGMGLKSEAEPLLHAFYIDIVSGCAIQHSDQTMQENAKKMKTVTLDQFGAYDLPEIYIAEPSKINAFKDCFSSGLNSFQSNLHNPNSTYHKFLKEGQYNVEAFSKIERYSVYFDKQKN